MLNICSAIKVTKTCIISVLFMIFTRGFWHSVPMKMYNLAIIDINQAGVSSMVKYDSIFILGLSQTVTYPERHKLIFSTLKHLLLEREFHNNKMYSCMSLNWNPDNL